MKKCVLSLLLAGAAYVTSAQSSTPVTTLTEARAYLATTDVVYPYIDSAPEFPGGTTAWNAYVTKSDLVPKASATARAQGMKEGVYTVVVRFAVMPDGSLAQVKTVGKPFGYGLEAAAIRLVAESGKWIPANVEGTDSKGYIHLPVKFSITD